MGDDVLDLPVLARVGLSAAPADAVDEVRARVHWVSHAQRRRRRRARADRADPARAGPLGRRSSPYVDEAQGTRMSVVRAAPRGARRAAGRPDDRQGLGALQAARRQVDRSAPRARVAALHPRPQLPGRQPDRSRDRGAEPRRQPRRRRARSPHDSRQPVPREGTGRQGDHRAPGAAAAAEAEQARARLRAALPRPRLQARRLRRSRARGVQRSAAARSRRTSTRCSTCRSCTRSSISGPRPTTRGSGSSKLADIDARPQNQAILAFLENEIGLEAMRRKDYAEAIRRFEAAIDLDARAVPAYLNLGDVRVAAGQRARSRGDLGEADRGRAGPRLPRVRSARGAGDAHRQRRSGSRGCAGG